MIGGGVVHRGFDPDSDRNSPDRRGPKFTDKWTFSGEEISQKEIFYPIDYNFGYPELFIIDRNFCSGI